MVSSSTNKSSSPFDGLRQNTSDVKRLLEIHEQLTGRAPGRRYKVAVLNKSGVVLITACWEAFIEDVVTKALEFIIDEIPGPENLPKDLRKTVARHFTNKDRRNNNELRVWDLAGDKWKSAALTILREPVDKFNTPTSANIDELTKKVIGLTLPSEHWYWQAMSKERARTKLDDYVDRRHGIAHRLKTDKIETKSLVEAYSTHVHHLAVITSNSIREYVYKTTGKYPWDEVTLQGG